MYVIKFQFQYTSRPLSFLKQSPSTSRLRLLTRSLGSLRTTFQWKMKSMMESMNGTDATAYSSIKKYSVKLSLSPLTWWLGNFRFGYIILNLWGPWVQNYIWVVVHPPPLKVLLKQKLVSEVLISILANVHVLCKGPKFFIRLCAKVPLPKMCDNKVCSNSWFQGKPAFNERWWIIFGKNQFRERNVLKV